jgi:UDP-hydrolysing UDP-N-acetyl-D-glucosamine 2-epimerase
LPRSKPVKYTVAVVTGTRAEFGLLRPVMDAIKKHKKLKLQVIAAGAHFLPPAKTIREIQAAYPVAARVPMQRPGKTGRAADAQALGRGVTGFAKAFAKLKPDWVVVLGDRIEAFAAASAASIAGIAVCHIHGGDRAEGIADEAMRHAITKLAHLHCAATKLSAERITKMGEKPEFVHVTGSPAIDGLDKIRPMSDAEARRLGDPECVVLLHPSGLDPSVEHNLALFVSCLAAHYDRMLLLAPNSDPGREIITKQWIFMRDVNSARLHDHLPRTTFLSLLLRLCMRERGALIGNSSAGLIEAAAIGIPTVNIGPRQCGRERGKTVLTLAEDGIVRWGHAWFERSLAFARKQGRARWNNSKPLHPYGDGRAGPRIAALLAKTNPHSPTLLRKHNSY